MFMFFWMNNNIKEEYIASTKNTPTAEVFIRRFFNKAADTEMRLGKDICDWNMNEIIEFYCSLLSRTGATIYNINSIFKKYTDYCISRNLTMTSINHYEEINDELIYKTCVNSTATEDRILTRKEVLDKISRLSNPSDRFLILGLFEGICGKDKLELAYVKPEDIYGNTVKLYTGRQFEISKELINIIIESANEYTYYGIDARGLEYKRDFLIEDRGAYKRFNNARTEVNGTRTAHNINNRLNAKAEFVTSSKALLNSGKIEMCKDVMDKKGISFADALRDPDVEYRYGVTKSIRQFILKYENIVGEL